MKKLLLSILTVSVSLSAYAAPKSLKKDFDTLGDNKVFAERVKQMDQDKKVRIVQNRIVDLYNRFEIGGSYGYNAGGDSYVTTQHLGGMLEFHFSPRFAMGIRYQHYFNELTSEGKTQYDTVRAAQNQDAASSQLVAGIDNPEDVGLLTFSYSPIYGKLNLFDMSVAHFDIYTLAGFGKMKLASGDSDVLTAGVGMGVWVTQNFSARLEGRYETYEDLMGLESYGIQSRRQNNIQGMFAIGILL
ncbi:MAG: outer membrane beta-barrel domain-containing protein [Bdellovibrionota bacterium]